MNSHYVTFETEILETVITVEAEYYPPTDDRMTGDPMDGMAAWEQGEDAYCDNLNITCAETGELLPELEKRMTDKDWLELENEVCEKANDLIDWE